eukprot:TRINITY_DN2841_c0_g5_i1.p1 TRINITY_DN2841_c0_g5~~TRINITY_DN2841_c0_g5_i1.p1  ORF type:complete len:340 (+),score=37.02 TRINITY_DN2841_c0_g5_i1:130-1149(+)
MEKPDSKMTRIALVVGFYFCISIALVILNKWVMGYSQYPFPHPFSVTWFQFVVALLCALILSWLGRLYEPLSFYPPFEYKLSRAIAVAPLTVAYLAMITLSNLCLNHVEASFYQVARSLHILFQVLLTYVILHEKTSSKVLQSCGLILLGFVLGSYGETRFSWSGIMYGCGASFFTALNALYVKKTLVIVDNNQWLLLAYNTVNSILLLTPIVFLSGELTQIGKLTFLKELTFWNGMTFTAVMGFLINIASFLQIKYTSPLTHMISGTAKGAVQTVLSILIFGNPWTSMNLLGTTVVIAGSGWYSWIRYQQMQQPKQPTPDIAPIPLPAEPTTPVRQTP